MQRDTAATPRFRWLPDESGALVKYEIVEPTSGCDWEGPRGRRPRVRLKGEETRARVKEAPGRSR